MSAMKQFHLRIVPPNIGTNLAYATRSKLKYFKCLKVRQMPKVSKMSKMAVNLWAERALPYWLRNERSFTIFFDLARIFQNGLL